MLGPPFPWRGGPPMSEAAIDADRPRLVSGVLPVGEMQGAGTKHSAWLIQRDDRYVVVSELVFRLVELCDGKRTAEELAAKLTETTPWRVGADDVRTLVEKKLKPLGMIEWARSDGDGPVSAERPRSALQINLRRKVLGPQAAQSIAGAFAFLFWPPLVALLMGTAAFAHVWLYFLQGPTASVAAVFEQPALFLLVIGSLLAAAVFHEFGHAAALVRGGGTVRGMGFGFYLVFPALYTDVTDTYRLPRRDRVRTDLGGPYFHMLAALAVVGLYLLTGAEFLLLIVVLIDVEIIRQFVPFLRLDGYWLLVDLTGGPDFFSQMGTYLKRFIPRLRDRDGDSLPRLRPAVQAVFLGYMVLAFVVLPALLLIMISRMPHILSLASASFLRYGGALVSAVEGEEWLSASARFVQTLLVGTQVLGLGVFAYLVMWRPVKRVWQGAGQLPEAGLRRRMRSALVSAVGALLMVIAVLLPWRVVGPLLARSQSGFSFGAGRIVLVCGIALALAAPVLLLGTPALRRAVAVVGLVVGLGAGLVAFDHFARTRTQLDQAIRASVVRSTGHQPSPRRQDELRRLVAQFGISVEPGAGTYVAIGAGALAMAGGVGGLVASMARRPPRRRTRLS